MRCTELVQGRQRWGAQPAASNNQLARNDRVTSGDEVAVVEHRAQLTPDIRRAGKFEALDGYSFENARSHPLTEDASAARRAVRAEDSYFDRLSVGYG